MDRGRSADERRADTGRLRGEHTAELRSSRQAARRGEAHDSAATPQTTESFQLFLNQASKYPLLTREEEVELAQRIERGDLAAKERLINSNLRLVVKFALRYAGHGLSREDLVQEAMLGLIRAAEKFDWRRGYKFSTYAVLWIKQAVQRGLDNTGRGVRIPAHIAQRERNVARAEADLRAEARSRPHRRGGRRPREAAARRGAGRPRPDQGHDQPRRPDRRRRHEPGRAPRRERDEPRGRGARARAGGHRRCCACEGSPTRSAR